MKELVVALAAAAELLFLYHIIGRMSAFLSENRETVCRERGRGDPLTVFSTADRDTAGITEEIGRIRRAQEGDVIVICVPESAVLPDGALGPFLLASGIDLWYDNHKRGKIQEKADKNAMG